MVVQIFRIKFNHSRPLSAKRIGQCIVSEQFYIGDIEIEDITDEQPDDGGPEV